jgi:hypothetical protein
MQVDDLLTYTFLVLLLCSFVASVYFWFIRKHRAGWRLWVAYVVRLAGGLFFGYAAFWSYQVLWDESPTRSTIIFVSFFAVPAILMSIPWGYLVLRLLAAKNDRESVATS